MKRIISCSILFVLLLLPVSYAIGKEHEKEGIDVENILWEHVKDTYDWHVTKIGGHDIVLHLPIIVKSSTGWHIFSSSRFDEEPNASGDRMGPYGLYISGGEKYHHKICERINGEEVRPLDISITKTVCVLSINSVILLLCILLPARWCKRHNFTDPAPKGFTGLVHMLVIYIYDEVLKPCLGHEARKYAPYLLTCFFFIFISNLMGVIPFPPGGGNLTGNIACTFFLAFCTFLVTNFTGTKEYWKEIFWPEVPTWLKVPVPIMPVIEFLGVFTKPFALMIRLFANMFAGHVMALSFVCIIFIMFEVNALLGSLMTGVSVIMSIFMMLLELLVCFIQALVFTMLSAVFISLAHIKHESAHA